MRFKGVIDGLEEAIYEAEDFVNEHHNGIPLCDYKKYTEHTTAKEKFRKASQKAAILERALSISTFNKIKSKDHIRF